MWLFKILIIHFSMSVFVSLTPKKSESDEFNEFSVLREDDLFSSQEGEEKEAQLESVLITVRRILDGKVNESIIFSDESFSPLQLSSTDSLGNNPLLNWSLNRIFSVVSITEVRRDSQLTPLTFANFLVIRKSQKRNRLQNCLHNLPDPGPSLYEQFLVHLLCSSVGSARLRHLQDTEKPHMQRND